MGRKVVNCAVSPACAAQGRFTPRNPRGAVAGLAGPQLVKRARYGAAGALNRSALTARLRQLYGTSVQQRSATQYLYGYTIQLYRRQTYGYRRTLFGLQVRVRCNKYLRKTGQRCDEATETRGCAADTATRDRSMDAMGPPIQEHQRRTRACDVVRMIHEP